MSDLNKLEKSLAEIEALADEILSKSEQPEAIDGGNETPETVEKSETPEQIEDGETVEKGLKPGDVSKEDTKQDGDVDNKANGEDADEDEDEDDKPKGEVKKSFFEEAQESSSLQKGFEVSEFLTEFTKLQGRITDALRGDVEKSLQSSAHTAQILAKSFNAIMKSQNELAKSLAALEARLTNVESQPVGRKAVVNVVEKSFNHSAGVQEPSKELSKGEKLQKLTDLALQGGQGVTIQDVINFETSDQLRPELESLFKQN
jgi:hypothetical protein